MSSSPSRRWVDAATLRLDRHDPYISIQHFMIFVRDQDQSLRFYLDQLGFSLVVDSCLESGDRWVAVAPSDGTAVLALVAPKAASEDYSSLASLSRSVSVNRRPS
jgi:predicted enzyme related to lactoylglutathione lyase